MKGERCNNTPPVRTRCHPRRSWVSSGVRPLRASARPNKVAIRPAICGKEVCCDCNCCRSGSSRCGVSTSPLRTFYQAWGRRKDLTQTYQSLLVPDELVRRPDALIFCAENQGINYWAIQCKDLEKVNPPVVKAYALPDWGMSELASPLVWEPNYARVSDFLDTLTYQHALCGGALHGS